MKFGDNLKIIRKQRKISQEVLAEKVGVSRQSISKWETGEAYPEMNNILQLCKIFKCHINDLVHEDMSDINSLDEETKMKVVKFKEEQQKKMKGISKAIYIISGIGKVCTTIGIIVLAIMMISVPFVTDMITLTDNSILINNTVLEVTSAVEMNQIADLLANYSKLQLIVIFEIVLVCAMISMFIGYKILSILEKLFKNIHSGETPFTLQNIDYIKKTCKCLTFVIIFSELTAIIMQAVTKAEVNISIDLVDIIMVLIAISISYIFEYGYQIQKDSEGVMYNEKE